MLVGHFAVTFVGARVEPRLSLGTLALASMLPDVLWPVFSMAGFEYAADRPGGEASDHFDAPISHSLLTVMIWAGLFAAGYFLWRRYARGARVLFAAVLSRWLLDSLSHRHALAPGLPWHFGLGLWSSLPATVVLEGSFWLLAITLYARATRPTERAGAYGFWPVIAFLSFVWVTNVRSGPPPPRAVFGSLIFFSVLVA